MNTDIILRTNVGFAPSDVLLATSTLDTASPTPGGSSLPRLRRRDRLTGQGHIHVTFTLSGDGRLVSRHELTAHLAGAGVLANPADTATRLARLATDDEEIALILNLMELLP